MIIVGYAIPAFLFAILLIVVFAGGSYLSWFPAQRAGFGRLRHARRRSASSRDYLWHLVLPVSALVIGGFATLTILTKNSFLNEISRQYVVTARAKGPERKPRAVRTCVPQCDAAGGGRNSLRRFIEVFFAGSLLIETIFGLDGHRPHELRGGGVPGLPGGIRHLVSCLPCSAC
jgi:microcin C transport system permease protein